MARRAAQEISSRARRYARPDLLSAGPLSEKNVGPFTYFLLEKNWRPFFAHHRRSLGGVARYFGISRACKKFAAPFCGGPLFGRTCWTCLNPPMTVREVK